jgi:2-keto-3-deoxy-L-rhamnonate aldolase RhmA
MRENRVKRILQSGGLALGTHVGGIADPQIVEIIGLAGFDAAFIDMEHTSYDLHDVQLAVMAAERVGITPIVRTPGFDPAFILRLLDMGVQGVQVPHVSSSETARQASQGGTLSAARRARDGSGQPCRRVRPRSARRAYGAVEP